MPPPRGENSVHLCFLHHLLQSVLLPPACHPLSCISPFAWGCAQQRVEEPHNVPGYRVCLPEERSLEKPQEVRSARQPHEVHLGKQTTKPTETALKRSNPGTLCTKKQ